jgi:hypothetical protein
VIPVWFGLMPMMRVDRKGAQDFGVDANNTSVKDGMFQTNSPLIHRELSNEGYVWIRYVSVCRTTVGSDGYRTIFQFSVREFVSVESLLPVLIVR